jgi:hypothetical protein
MSDEIARAEPQGDPLEAAAAALYIGEVMHARLKRSAIASATAS